MEVVKTFKGKMIFTPGNIIYSSTQLLNLEKPNLKYEKLLTVMKINKIKFNKLHEVIKNFKNNLFMF